MGTCTKTTANQQNMGGQEAAFLSTLWHCRVLEMAVSESLTASLAPHSLLISVPIVRT
jgi:hypothetical protein